MAADRFTAAGVPADEDHLVCAAPFAEGRAGLIALSHGLRRLLHRAAAWVIAAPLLAEKILLGELIGFVGLALCRLDERLSEKLLTAYASPGPPGGTGASETDPRSSAARAAWLSARCGELEALLSAQLRAAEAFDGGLADQPTCWTLRELSRGLCAQRERLLAAVGEAGPVDAAPLCLNSTGPGRPAHLRHAKEGIVTHRTYRELCASPEMLRRFAHYVYVDIEIAAMEVCARDLLLGEAAGLPLGFALDMARQIWDEARHAVRMRGFLLQQGGAEGDYTYSAKVWHRCELGRDLAERLAIQQVFQEGNALESNLVLTRALRDAGHAEMAAHMDYINADEAVHVQIGNRWLRRLCEGDEGRYHDTLERAAALLGTTFSSNVQIDEAARRVAGFPAATVEVLRKNNERAGYRKA